MIKLLLNKVKSKETLSTDQSKIIMDCILDGEVEETDIVSLLDAYDKKGIESDEIVGFLSSLKQFCLPFESFHNAIDTCGTGGSKKARFNISTSVAFVLAASKETVVKHGNYGSIKPNGSFNFLESLGIPFLLTSEQLEQIVKQTHCCFLFARSFHPAMKHVVSARKIFAKRSFFNLLGPLANPANVKYQLIGLPNDDNLTLLIDVVRKLDMKKVIFVIGGDGRDEISLEGTSKIIEVTPKQKQAYDFNFKNEIKQIDHNYTCGDSKENAALFNTILQNKDFDHPIIEHICINAAAGFLVLSKVNSLKEGYQKAKKLFEEEAVKIKIEEIKKLSKKLASQN